MLVSSFFVPVGILVFKEDWSQGRLVGCLVHDIWPLKSRILQTFTLF